MKIIIVSLLAQFATTRNARIQQMKKINWTSFVILVLGDFILHCNLRYFPSIFILFIAKIYYFGATFNAQIKRTPFLSDIYSTMHVHEKNENEFANFFMY